MAGLFLFIPMWITFPLFMIPRYGFTRLCVRFLEAKGKKIEIPDVAIINTLGFFIQMLIVALIFYA